MNEIVANAPARTRTPEGRAVHAHPHEVLTLRLGGEEYAIDILRVQEIRSYETPTQIAGAPAHMLGVTNLRGTVVPIVDLRRRLGFEPVYDGSTVTVVLNVGRRTVGAVVDAVSDVVALQPGQVKPAPDFAQSADLGHVIGIATLDGREGARMLILLDIEAFMSRMPLGTVPADLD